MHSFGQAPMTELSVITLEKLRAFSDRSSTLVTIDAPLFGSVMILNGRVLENDRRDLCHPRHPRLVTQRNVRCGIPSLQSLRSDESLVDRLDRLFRHWRCRADDALAVGGRFLPGRDLQIRQSRDFHFLAWQDFSRDLLLAESRHRRHDEQESRRRSHCPMHPAIRVWRCARFKLARGLSSPRGNGPRDPSRPRHGVYYRWPSWASVCGQTRSGPARSENRRRHFLFSYFDGAQGSTEELGRISGSSSLHTGGRPEGVPHLGALGCL